MGVFTFVCKSSGGAWTAKQLHGDLEGCGDSTYALQRKLVNVALSADNSGAVQTSFSHVLPDSGVFQVIIGGGGGDGGDGASFGGAAASAPSGGAVAAEAPAAEEKKEESDDDDFIMSLFDD